MREGGKRQRERGERGRGEREGGGKRQRESIMGYSSTPYIGMVWEKMAATIGCV